MIQNILKKINSLSVRGRKKKKVLTEWFTRKGDSTYLIDYPINEKSIVFDIGGYRGQWSSDIFSKYFPTIYVFEPVTEFHNFLVKRFEKNKKIKMFNFGLGPKDSKAFLSMENDKSSLYGKKSGKKIKIVGISNFINSKNIKKIDLISMNIEGAEYDLLDEIINENLMEKIDHLQIQFHENVKNYRARRIMIHEKLKRTHKMTYCFPFVWESWTKK